ncbi:MAG: hypothetical protein V4727_08610 [Verrucomicrobiota bacterium]
MIQETQDNGDVSPEVKSSTRSPRSLRSRLIRSLIRICSLLMILFMAGCYLIAQPSMRSNEPSSKKADEVQLRKDVDALSKNFHPRNSGNPENLNRCAEYISTHLKDAGATVEMQDFIVDKITYRNVIGRFGVGKPKKIIVGAHYDSCEDTPGAMTTRVVWLAC